MAKKNNFAGRAIMKKGQWSISVPEGFLFSDIPENNGKSNATGRDYDLIIAKPFAGEKPNFISPYENKMVFVTTHNGASGFNGAELDSQLAELILNDNVVLYSAGDWIEIEKNPLLRVYYQPSVSNYMFGDDFYSFSVLIITPFTWTSGTFLFAIKNEKDILKGETLLKEMLQTILTPEMSEKWNDCNYIRATEEKSQNNNPICDICLEPEQISPDEELYPHYYHLGARYIGLAGISVAQSSRGTQFACLPVKGLLKDKNAEKRILTADTEKYTLHENAKKFSAIFSVSKKAFNSEDDRENDILNSNLKKIEVLHALRSFAWSLMSYCDNAKKDIADVQTNEAEYICNFIAEQNNLNYQSESYFKTLCGTTDLHVAFLPENITQNDKNIFLPSDEDIEYHNNMKAKFPNFNEILGTVASLSDLRAELKVLLPVMDKLAELLLDSRDYEKPLEGAAADVLYAWCTLAIAAKDPFYTEDGPMMCDYSQLGTEKPNAVKTKKTESNSISKVTEKATDRSFYNADIYNMLERYNVPESRTKLLRQLKSREELDNPSGCDLIIKKFVRSEENTLLEKAYIQHNKFDDAKFYNEITAAAKEFARLFRVNVEVFNPECDTEAEIYAGYIKHISAIHALKSLATMIYPYAKKVNKEYSDITIEEIYNMVYMIEDCGGSNFKSQAARGDRWLQCIRDVAEVKYSFRCYDGDSHFKKEYIKKDFTLLGLIDDLYEMMPLMRKIYDHLSENRDRNVYLKSTLSKILSAWCTYALATDSQFDVVKGIDSYSLAQCVDSTEDEPVLYSTTEDGIVYYNDCMLDYIGDNKTLIVPAFIKSIPYEYVPFGIAEHIIYMSSETSFGCLKDSKITTVEIAKDTVKLDFGFSNNDVVKKVILPDGLKEIGYQCFYYCSELKSVNIPDSVKVIDSVSFTQCANLEVTIPASVKEIKISPYLLKSFTYIKGVKAYRDSFAAAWLTRHKIPFETILSEEQKEADRLKAIHEAEERERRRREEEDRRRLEAKRKRREEEARIAEEKRIAAQRKSEFDRLTEEKEEQLKIIEENKGIFGQKAKNRKEAKKKLEEILLELEKYPEFKE